MKYTEWLDEGKPFDTLFSVQRKIDMVELDDSEAITEAINDLTGTLRVVDMYILSKHQATMVQPDEAIHSGAVAVDPHLKDYRRMFMIVAYDEKYDGLTMGYIVGKQFYDTHEDNL